jgi:hypothetical protein
VNLAYRMFDFLKCYGDLVILCGLCFGLECVGESFWFGEFVTSIVFLWFCSLVGLGGLAYYFGLPLVWFGMFGLVCLVWHVWFGMFGLADSIIF